MEKMTRKERFGLACVRCTHIQGVCTCAREGRHPVWATRGEFSILSLDDLRRKEPYRTRLKAASYPIVAKSVEPKEK